MQARPQEFSIDQSPAQLWSSATALAVSIADSSLHRKDSSRIERACPRPTPTLQRRASPKLPQCHSPPPDVTTATFRHRTQHIRSSPRALAIRCPMSLRWLSRDAEPLSSARLSPSKHGHTLRHGHGRRLPTSFTTATQNATLHSRHPQP